MWTDSSKKVKNGQIIVGRQTVYNAELQAIEYALNTVEKNVNIIIFSDSESAVKKISKCLNSRFCHKNDATIKRILAIIKEKQTLNAKTTIFHCYAIFLIKITGLARKNRNF
jgi:ribonuclease HI